MSGTRFATVALGMSASVIVWALHFAAIYGGTALACARGHPAAVLPIVAAATIVAVAALVPIAWRSWVRRADFEHWMSASLAALALLAVAWETIPLWLVPPCG